MCVWLTCGRCRCLDLTKSAKKAQRVEAFDWKEVVVEQQDIIADLEEIEEEQQQIWDEMIPWPEAREE